MAEETSLKASEPNRAIRVVVGVAVIGVLLAALGWMVPHFIAQPARATLTQETPTGMSSGYAPHWKAEEIVEVPFGETVVLDDLDWGMKYDLEASPYLQEDWDSMTDAERKASMESESWDEEIAPFSARVVDYGMVSAVRRDEPLGRFGNAVRRRGRSHGGGRCRGWQSRHRTRGTAEPCAAVCRLHGR